MTSKQSVIIFIFIMITALLTYPIFGAQDNSPVISDLVVFPNIGGHGTRVKITLKIIDPQGKKDIDKFLYQIRGGREMIKIGLYDDGTHGDEKANDNTYTGEMVVPDTAAEKRHQFSVFVYDKERHRSNILTYEFVVVGKEI